jgi:hypothetical protein
LRSPYRSRSWCRGVRTDLSTQPGPNFGAGEGGVNDIQRQPSQAAFIEVEQLGCAGTFLSGTLNMQPNPCTCAMQLIFPSINGKSFIRSDITGRGL